MKPETIQSKYKKSFMSHIGDMKRTLFMTESANLHVIRGFNKAVNINNIQKQLDLLQEQLNEANARLQEYKATI